MRSEECGVGSGVRPEEEGIEGLTYWETEDWPRCHPERAEHAKDLLESVAILREWGNEGMKE